MSTPARILLAEDHRILRKAGEVSLRKKGYDDHKPDLVLLDVMMPKMHGFDVLYALKGDPSFRDIPVIMLTNLEQPADIQRAADAGAHSYLVKSNMNLDELAARIAEALANR